MKKSLKKGFTLVELVIVIAVIAILSAVLIPTFGNVIQNSKETAAFQNAKSAIDTYTIAQADNGNTANLADGWVVVFTGQKDYEAKTWTLDSSTYIFRYENGALVQKQGKEVLKGGSTNTALANVVFAMSGITTSGTGESASWTATSNATSLPLNYSFKTANPHDNVTASVWWFSGSAPASQS